MHNRREFLKMTSASLALLPLTFSVGSAQVLLQNMQTRAIPSSGEQLPVIGFGQSAAFRNGDLKLSSKLLDVLIEKGGRFIDTGGKGQQTLGRFMAAQKAHDQLFLGTNIYSSTKDEILKEIHQAQQLQGKTTLDLVQIRSLDQLERQWQALLEWKQAGLTRYIGFAMSRRNYYEPIMKLMQTGTVDFVQVNYSMLEPQAAEQLLPLAQEKGVAIVTNRPYLNGKYFELVRDRQLPGWAQEFDCHSWGQFSLKYILANPAVNCVLTETTKTKHAIDNLSAGYGRLPDTTTQEKMLKLIRSFM